MKSISLLTSLALLAACATPFTSSKTGALTDAPVTQTASLDIPALKARLGQFEEGQWILKENGDLLCGVEVLRFEYNTKDGRGDPTTASAALMLPTGDGADCTGPRPIVLGLHGTTPDRAYNLSDLSGTNSASPRAIAFAATYAARGYITLAPNYAGYDTSPLDHHPYHVADQHAGDVIDALTAARKILRQRKVKESGKLFAVGYSQGGFITMAVHREMERRGMKITGSVPSSGAYALAAIGDDSFLGRPVQFSTIYFPILIHSYQKTYGDIYNAPEDFYNAPYADDLAELFPTPVPFADLVKQGRVPATALFEPGVTYGADSTSVPASSRPYHQSGFGTPALIAPAFREAYVKDALAYPDGAAPDYTTGAKASGAKHPLRRALMKNDLRGWTPQAPLTLCGGKDDPSSPFRFGGEAMMKYWSAPGTAAPAGRVTLLDMESAPTPDDPFAAMKTNFASIKAEMKAAGKEAQFMDGYHGSILPRHCYTAARQWFDTMK